MEIRCGVLRLGWRCGVGGGVWMGGCSGGLEARVGLDRGDAWDRWTGCPGVESTVLFRQGGQRDGEEKKRRKEKRRESRQSYHGHRRQFAKPFLPMCQECPHTALASLPLPLPLPLPSPLTLGRTTSSSPRTSSPSSTIALCCASVKLSVSMVIFGPVNHFRAST